MNQDELPQPPGERFVLLSTTRYLVPAALLCALLGAIFLSEPRWRISFLLLGAVWAGAWLLLRQRRPELWVDRDGYRVLVREDLRFAVRWSEVSRVLCDRSEGALYADCGDPARNLLLPPQRGYGFTFTDRERLFHLVRKGAPDRIEEVGDLSAAVAGGAGENQ